MPNAPLIRLINISYQQKNRRILHDISFNIAQQGILTLVGPNGAGKTTLLNLILGILSPTSGKIERHQPLKLSLVPQHFTPPNDLPITAKRFLMPLSLNTDWLSALKLTDKLNTPLQHLSGGETQRLLLLRAILRKPNLLILDEPASGIDPTTLADFYGYIRQAQQQLNCSVLIVSHDLHLVMAQSDEVICLNGHICCQGHPKDISQHPEYQKLLGKNQLAFYPHYHTHQHL